MRSRTGDNYRYASPDFDSHRSHDYRALIAKICALVDVFVLVVSKEKYSDLEKVLKSWYIIFCGHFLLHELIVSMQFQKWLYFKF